MKIKTFGVGSRYCPFGSDPDPDLMDRLQLRTFWVGSRPGPFGSDPDPNLLGQIQILVPFFMLEPDPDVRAESE
jgi:hypothetical protein